MKLDAGTEAWELEEAAKLRRRMHDPYLIPSLADLFRVHPGDRVELLFSFRGRDRHGPFLQCERHWLTVTDLDGSHGAGVLDSDPACSDLLRIGDRVEFEHRHLLSIQRAPVQRERATI